MSAACGCTKAVGSTTGMSPSREYTVTACLRSCWARSAAAPAREEGAHARAKLLRLQLRAEDAGLLFDASEQLSRVAAQQAPRGGERFRGLLGHRARQRARLIEKRSLLDHTVHQPEAVRSVGIEGLTQEQEFRRALVTDQARQQERAARLGHQSQRDEWQGELRGASRHDEVTMQQHGHADPHRLSLDGSEERLAEGGERT